MPSISTEFRPLDTERSHQVTAATAAASSPGTLDQLADYLTDGYWNDNFGSRHVFDTSVSNVITVNITALSADGQRLARWAMEAWESVADIRFSETSGPAQITFSDNQSGAYSSYYAIGGITQWAIINVSTAWLNDYGTQIDDYPFSTYLHEIGHALGLGHQGDYNGSATYGVDETFANDSYQVSLMSYFSQTENTFVNASYGLPVTAMIADIIAIQNLYGAPDGASSTAGDTIYGVGQTIGGYLGVLFDAMLSNQDPNNYYGDGPVALTLYDQSGADTVDLSTDITNQRVDLRNGGIWDTFGQIGNIVVARGTVLENYIAGSGNDLIIGNSAFNALYGNDGQDTLYGLNGDDTLSGGAGDDRVRAGGGNDLLAGDGGNDSLFGQAGDDTLSGGDGFDSLLGQYGNDTLNGGNGNDVLNGGPMNDVLYGDGGNDTLDGATGSDWLDGGDGADELRGGKGQDSLFGGAGNDLLTGGLHSDVLDGGAGNDTLRGQDGKDTLFGGAGDDLLAGGLHSDVLEGGAGNDTLWGQDGYDTLEGGAGNDRLVGGDHPDDFVFAAGFGRDTIADFEDNRDEIFLDAAIWGGNLTAQQVVDTFGRISGNSTVLDFGNGQMIILSGLSDMTALYDDIVIF